MKKKQNKTCHLEKKKRAYRKRMECKKPYLNQMLFPPVSCMVIICSKWQLHIPENHLLLVQHFGKPKITLFLLVTLPNYVNMEYTNTYLHDNAQQSHVPTCKLNMYLKYWRIFIVSFFFLHLNTKSMCRVAIIHFL